MGFRAPGLQDRKIRALGLHGCTLELRLAGIIIFVRYPKTERLSFGLRAPRQKFQAFGLSRAAASIFQEKSTNYW